ALVGSEVPAGAVENVHRASGVGPAKVDDGWSKEGRLWITYRLTASNLRTGAFAIPVGYHDLIAGEYFVQASGTGSRDKLVAEDGRLCGLRRSTVIRGAEPGDLLTITFDLRQHQVEVKFADESSSGAALTEPSPAFIPPPIVVPN